MRKLGLVIVPLLCLLLAGTATAALVVPTEIQQPGTQPGEVGNLETPRTTTASSRPPTR